MGRPYNDERIMSVLAARVRRLREEQMLSQVDLSRQVGLHKTAIAHIEAGRRAPSLGRLVALARALGVSTDHLLGES